MSESMAFSIELEQLAGYEFKVKFDSPGVAELLLDEPAPLGAGRGPNAARLVAAAVANCLSASLVFCVKGKFKQALGPVRAKANAHLVRNDKGRYRIGSIDVKIFLSESAREISHLDRCGAQFEDFCVVTESIRAGIPVAVEVVDATGAVVHRSTPAAPASS